MRTVAIAVLVVCFCASLAAAETATIEKTDKGVSISISGPKRRAPAKVEPAGADTAKGAVQSEAGKKEIFPAVLYAKLSPAQKERADAIVEILKKYSSRNTYSELSETQCKQMSEAIWFRLAGKGIPARLAAGRVDAQVTTAVDIFVRKANHAWVMAELSAGEWVALETTNGTVVSKEMNQLYYVGGVFFQRPEDVYRFDGARRKLRQYAKKYDADKARYERDAKGQTYMVGSKKHKEMLKRREELEALRKKMEEQYDILESMIKRGVTLQ